MHSANHSPRRPGAPWILPRQWRLRGFPKQPDSSPAPDTDSPRKGCSATRRGVSGSHPPNERLPFGSNDADRLNPAGDAPWPGVYCEDRSNGLPRRGEARLNGTRRYKEFPAIRAHRRKWRASGVAVRPGGDPVVHGGGTAIRLEGRKEGIGGLHQRVGPAPDAAGGFAVAGAIGAVDRVERATAVPQNESPGGVDRGGRPRVLVGGAGVIRRRYRAEQVEPASAKRLRG
jgi:hypothetical protein